MCGAYWCNVHQSHAHECDCPDPDRWEGSPYLCQNVTGQNEPMAGVPIDNRSGPQQNQHGLKGHAEPDSLLE